MKYLSYLQYIACTLTTLQRLSPIYSLYFLLAFDWVYVMHAYVAYVTRTMCPHACVRAQMCAEHAWVQLMMLATYTVVQATHVLTMLTYCSLSK